MPVTNIHCVRCGTDFVDARQDLREGDEAVCPHCGARHALHPQARVAAAPEQGNVIAHAEPPRSSRQ